MSTVETRTPRSERETMILDLVARISVLFARLPMLSGFSVQERTNLTAEREAAALDAELSVADVSVHTWPGFPSTAGVPPEIVAALLDCSRNIRPPAGCCEGTHSHASSTNSSL